MSSRLCWDEVRACRPARRSSNQSQTTGGCYGSDIVCDWECSHHGYMYTTTVSDKNGTLYTVDFAVVHRAAYLPYKGCFLVQLLVEAGQAETRASLHHTETWSILLSSWEWYSISCVIHLAKTTTCSTLVHWSVLAEPGSRTYSEVQP